MDDDLVFEGGFKTFGKFKEGFRRGNKDDFDTMFLALCAGLTQLAKKEVQPARFPYFIQAVEYALNIALIEPNEETKNG